MGSNGRRIARRLVEAVRERPVSLGLVVVAALVLIAVGVRFVAFPEPALVVERSDGQELDASSDGQSAKTEGADGASIYVHVTGSVVAPGLYELPEGARVAEAVDAAGGFAEGAATESINLARVLFDGEQIAVASVESLSAETNGGQGAPAAVSDGKVNINTADATELDSITGVGPSTAEKIIADREANGPYQAIEDLKRVSGIGDKKFESMRDEICVG